jgi:hypothetical protein
MKVETTETGNYGNSTWMLLFTWIQTQKGMLISCVIILVNSRNISPVQDDMRKWYKGKGSHYSEEFHFTRSYHHTSTQCQWHANVSSLSIDYMVLYPRGLDSSNTNVFRNGIQLHHQWCRCNTCYNNTLRQQQDVTVMLTELADNK